MLRNLFSAAFLVLSVTAAAQAETPLQMQVSLVDLNLNHPAGQAAAQARIHAAAVRLCGSVRDTAQLGGWASLEAVSDHGCIARAVERANAQIASTR
ncbi:MAG: UrcA family protein [Alphaproteobacteria bacterium]|nr:UrcA family protein [Alphaproteobacteria bacterium]